MVLLLVAGLLTAGLWLSIGFDQKTYKKYLVYMNEPVSGLSDKSLVKYNGVKVGYVDRIQLNPSNPEQVRLVLNVDAAIRLTTGVRASLVSQGITGATYMGLSSISSSTTPIQPTPSEPYPVIPSQPSFLGQLQKNVDDITDAIKQVLDTRNAASIKKTLLNLQKITSVIAANQDGIHTSLQELPKVLVDLQTAIRQFNVMATDMSEAGVQVSGTMKAAKKGINQLSQQAIPPTVLLLRRLDLIATNLEKVSASMRQNPSVILRGTASPTLGPGE